MKNHLPAADRYLCPGETQPISRAIHLGRLTASYPACRECAHRLELTTLSLLQRRRVEQSLRPRETAAHFDGEGLTGKAGSQLTPPVARRAAMALGRSLADLATSGDSLVVALGHDGRADAAALLAAVADGLRGSGATVVDAGGVTASWLALGMHRSSAVGGIYLGNPTGEPHQLGLRFWRPGGRPISQHAGLEAIEARMSAPPDRPDRRLAPIARRDLAADYLAMLRPYFHALRPLRIVVDSHCLPLVRAMQELTSQVGCRIVTAREASGQVAGRSTTADRGASWREQRWRVVARQVVNEHAHFGLWVDGAGEACHWIDERGQAVSDGMIARLIAKRMDNQSDKRETRPPSHSYAEPGLPSSRAATFARMRDGAERIADDGQGRIWFGGAARPRLDEETEAPPLPCPVPDALLAFTWLLVILSQSDRALSRVLEIAFDNSEE